MAEQHSQDEKTEQATPRRREDSRKKGQVAKSQELSSVFIILTGVVALGIFYNNLLTGFAGAFQYNFSKLGTEITPTNFYELFLTNGNTLIGILAPVLLMLAVVAILINIAQVGFMISLESIQPKLEKLNLLKGLKRIFSMRTLFNFFRDSIKIAIIATIVYFTYKSEMVNFIPLADQELGQMITFMGKTALKIVLRASLALLFLAALDYAYQKYEHEKSMKMTKQEVKDEMKQMDGDPMIKMRIKRIQREMARQRMLQEVETADVVVTNPTHLAVALKYDSDNMAAPMVVAKGQRLIAQKIKEVAKEAGVPVVENKPLAQALYKSVEVGMAIPAKLFKAVAEVLAYVYKLKGKA